ncbi:MAG: hypothetical protein ABW000_00105 [Actinoplanes sp.]
MSEPLFVDPQRLAQYADPYEAAAQDWFQLQDTVGGIRARYNGAWGDDDLGNKFGPSFNEGMDSVEQRAKGVGDTLRYYGEGLVKTGKIFGDAGDSAEESAYQLLTDAEEVGGYDSPDGSRYFGIKSVNLQPSEESADEQNSPPFLASRKPVDASEAGEKGERGFLARRAASEDGSVDQPAGEGNAPHSVLVAIGMSARRLPTEGDLQSRQEYKEGQPLQRIPADVLYGDRLPTEGDLQSRQEYKEGQPLQRIPADVLYGDRLPTEGNLQSRQEYKEGQPLQRIPADQANESNWSDPGNHADPAAEPE